MQLKFVKYSLKTALIFYVLFIVSCKKDPPLYEIKNLNENNVTALGHGGMGIKSIFPIDTWESIKECLRIGAEGVEIDVQMTKDCVLVAYHHQKLEDGTNCTGVIHDKKWSEIKNCLFNSPLPSRIYLMRLEDIFSRINNINQCVFSLDCKLYTDNPNALYVSNFSNAIIKLVNAYEMHNNMLIEAYSATFLKVLKNKNNTLKLFIYRQSFDDGLSIAEKLDLFGITIESKLISREQVDFAHSKGLRIILWNVKTQQENYDAVEKSPDYIQTDKIRHLLKSLGKNKK